MNDLAAIILLCGSVVVIGLVIRDGYRKVRSWLRPQRGRRQVKPQPVERIAPRESSPPKELRPANTDGPALRTATAAMKSTGWNWQSPRRGLWRSQLGWVHGQRISMFLKACEGGLLCYASADIESPRPFILQEVAVTALEQNEMYEVGFNCLVEVQGELSLMQKHRCDPAQDDAVRVVSVLRTLRKQLESLVERLHAQDLLVAADEED